MEPRVLISGASIAGPALAHWLHRHGYDVTVVEKAPQVRAGGQAVDFKGPIHLSVLDRMGILPQVREKAVPSEDGAIVNASGRRIGTSPGAFIGGDINIGRGELAQILYAHTAESCRYVFSDSITSLTQTPDAVEVTFRNGPDESYDLVFGADGMHSTVRRLSYGPETDYVKNLGYYYALADIDISDEQVMYSEPGRTVILGGTKASTFFVFASPDLPASRDDVDRQKQQVKHAYAGGRWRIPEILDALDDSPTFYLDSISRASVDSFSRGRVALLGDAAWGNALGGFGTGLAVVGAYVLAGELHRAGDDHRTGLANFEKTFRAYSSVSEKINGGQILAPRTRRGMYLRNAGMSVMSRFSPLLELVERPARSNLELRDYESDVIAS